MPILAYGADQSTVALYISLAFAHTIAASCACCCCSSHAAMMKVMSRRTWTMMMMMMKMMMMMMLLLPSLSLVSWRCIWRSACFFFFFCCCISCLPCSCCPVLSTWCALHLHLHLSTWMELHHLKAGVLADHPEQSRINQGDDAFRMNTLSLCPSTPLPHAACYPTLGTSIVVLRIKKMSIELSTWSPVCFV